LCGGIVVMDRREKLTKSRISSIIRYKEDLKKQFPFRGRILDNTVKFPRLRRKTKSWCIARFGQRWNNPRWIILEVSTRSTLYGFNSKYDFAELMLKWG
jgi:hypothetical protein